MITLDYSAADVPVRADLRETHVAMLEYLRQPGSWFTGGERLALAAESRNALACPLCRARKTSLSPEQPAGEHARVSDLPEALVEIAHRIRLDPQRLSRSWFDRIREAGLEEGPLRRTRRCRHLHGGHRPLLPCARDSVLPPPRAGTGRAVTLST